MFDHFGHTVHLAVLFVRPFTRAPRIMAVPSTVSDQVRALYDEVGWTEQDGITHDAAACEDLRPVARDYVSACRLRVLRHLPASGDRLLDLGSGPIQYPEYMEYGAAFRTRVCVDLSQRALDMAAAKLGARGEYHCGDFLELSLPDASVDAAVSLHAIYHMDARQQAAAVRKLVRVTKPGGSVVIVYSNPGYLISRLGQPIRKLVRALRGRRGAGQEDIYFHRFPLKWWKQFEDVARVELYPWRTFASRDQKLVLRSRAIGRALFALEDRFPALFLRAGCYPMIVLKPRTQGSHA
jgi:SAM-dependent methyltransferase